MFVTVFIKDLEHSIFEIFVEFYNRTIYIYNCYAVFPKIIIKTSQISDINCVCKYSHFEVSSQFKLIKRVRSVNTSRREFTRKAKPDKIECDQKQQLEHKSINLLQLENSKTHKLVDGLDDGLHHISQLNNDSEICSSSDKFLKEDKESGNEFAVKKSGNDILRELLTSRNLKVSREYLILTADIPNNPSSVCGILWDHLKEEFWRLQTFSNYPLEALKSPILLAGDGFAYLGTGKERDDLVICAFCCAKKNNWQSSDDISLVHASLSPKCSMVTKINCPNVAITHGDPNLFDKLFQGTYINSQYQHRINVNDLEHDGVTSSATPVGLLKKGDASPSNSNYDNRPCNAPSQNHNQSSESGHFQQGNTPNGVISQLTASSSGSAISSLSSTTSSIITTVSTSSVPATSPTPLITSSSTVLPSVTTNTTPGLASATGVAVVHEVSITNQNVVKGNASGPTYSELGIVTERPKRFEYALLPKRMETFASWPRDHHLTPKELAEAGFYFAGYGDCARCFYCGGGLRNWEDEDDVWVEHARWFPKCAYIRQQLGQVFVDTVQELNKIKDQISYGMVIDKIGIAASAFHLDSKDNPLKRDPAVRTVVEMGFPESEAIVAAENVKDDGNTISADKIYEKLTARNIKRNSATVNRLLLSEPQERDIEKLRTLKEQNNQLRQQTVCKICMDKDVGVVFLPCGHLVSCTDCAVAMKDCPVCRKHVKGIVRAFMG